MKSDWREVQVPNIIGGYLMEEEEKVERSRRRVIRRSDEGEVLLTCGEFCLYWQSVCGLASAMKIDEMDGGLSRRDSQRNPI